jgi:hypothetical protein
MELGHSELIAAVSGSLSLDGIRVLVAIAGRYESKSISLGVLHPRDDVPIY